MNYCPWDAAFKLCNGAYTREEIDEMSLCEIKEITLDQND